ncbi:MAG: LysR family transcriptional regulator [Alphaproteobacteria bacterium]
MDWDKLRIFYAVAEAGSFTAAGDSLNLSQSAVSRQISTLENSLDTTLFHRHARGLILTEQGEILAEAARDMHAKLSLLEGKLTDTKELAEGPLTITVSDFIGSTWLAPKLAEFRAAYPDIQLTILFEDRILNLGMREADAAVRLRTSKQGDMVQKHLAQIHFHICASREYLDKNGRPQSVEDLKKHTLIAFPKDTFAPFTDPNWIFEIAKIDVEHDFNVIMMNSMYAIHKAVKVGAGIAVLPDYLINEAEHLEVLFPDLERPAVDMYFTYPEQRKGSKRMAALRDFLLEKTENSTL